jgi:hypothetical protein
MPYNPPGGTNAFFATVHVGPDASFAPELPALNAYLTRLCSWMRQGRTYSKLAIYFRWEDNLMRDRLPRELRSPAAQFYWEMRHELVPREIEGYHPLWISAAFLKHAAWDGTRLRAGAAEFEALYLDCSWLDPEALDEVLRLARAGLPVILTRRPRRPGRLTRSGDPSEFESRLDDLMELPSVSSSLTASGITPLVEGPDLPEFWAREVGDDLILLFAHPATREIRYPMQRGQADRLQPARRRLTIHAHEQSRHIDLQFRPNRSVLLKVTRQDITQIDLRD